MYLEPQYAEMVTKLRILGKIHDKTVYDRKKSQTFIFFN